MGEQVVPVHDVVVVGAGPGGAMAALGLARAGLDVVLFEQRRTVGEPVRCGEALSAFALENNGLAPVDEFVVNEVKGIRLMSPNGTEYNERMPGYCIRRDRFDQHIAGLAEAMGAEVRLGTRVRTALRRDGTWRLQFDGGELDARVMVAADGPLSRLGRAAGLGSTGRMARAVQYKFRPMDDLKDDHLRFLCGERYAGGYAWTFDRGFEVNVGVVSSSSPRPKLDALCRELGLDPADRTGITGGVIPQGGPSPRLAGEGIVTVGDAAGLANPCSSGGIHPALHSGRVAAGVIAEAFGSGDPRDLGAYESEMRSAPICSPVLKEAREFLDELTDAHWDTVLALLRARDMGQLKGMGSLSRFILDSPFAISQLWRLRILGKAYDTYSTWGW